jgi:D-alanyl-D-alanine carboxypeptidase (penicillin-binding protein 5/6)
VFSSLAATAIAQGPPDAPQILAKSAIVVDERSGKVLYEKAADAKRFPASTTKILTSLLVIERCRPEEMVTAPLGVDEVEGSSLHLKPGERLSVRDLLYGLMVRSANDGSVTAAIHVAGSIPGFARLMNKRAKAIGCTNTNFVAPHGLHDPNHYTSARDLSLIAREAMKDPLFRQIARTRKIQIRRSMNQEDTWLISKNRMLESDPTADGIKTGYTNDAGSCYVGSATRGGFRFITVVLASESWKEDHKALIDWAFKTHTRSMVSAPGMAVGSAKVEGGAAPAVTLLAQDDVYYAHRRDVAPNLSVSLSNAAPLKAPIEAGQSLGEAVLSDGAGWQARVPVVAATAVPKATLFSAGGRPISFAVIGGLLLVGGMAMRGRSRRLYAHGLAPRK